MTKQKKGNKEGAKTNSTNRDKISPSAIETEEFLIVALGASAGGLETFKLFFSNLPENPNMSFVLVQHLDPTHKSLMVDLLKKDAKMSVTEVKDNTKIEVNHVYVIPPNKDMAIFNGVLHLMEPNKARGLRKPIDFFFRSLANDQGERAVGIVLSGTGSEGTLGLKDIKGLGGLSIVQDPTTSKYDGMPRSAYNAKVYDFVLPVEQIPDLLLKYSKNRNLKPIEATAVVNSNQDLLEKVFILLRNKTGCNFNDYKSNTVIRRIEKRMAINQIEKLEDYVKYLRKNADEISMLFQELLIGVTSFFRDKKAYEILCKEVIPKLIQKKADGDTIRIWVAGCSTGEEAYSLAILFDEVISIQKKDIKIQIFASDIDQNAINTARLGMFPDTIVADVGKERLSSYFLSEASGYRIKKEIRDQIIFAEHNLLKDPPFSKLDFISCRNLLIYLNIDAQKKVFSIFHYALLNDGILFLGSSESLGDYADIFDPVDRKHKIFKRKNIKQNNKLNISYNFSDPIRHSKTVVSPTSKKVFRDNLVNATERLLITNYAPACAIINGIGDAVYFSGNTGKYLQPSPGEASLKLIDMARKGLKTELSSLISKVLKTNKIETKREVKVMTNGSFQMIDLCVRPLRQPFEDENYLMITFEDVNEATTAAMPSSKSTKIEDLTEARAIQQELSSTKEYLRSTIEELEVSNEELKSSNEELQSSNEELQSTNEELETSKEELQSVNEEIITVNTELQGKIDELAKAYDDMNNLLASTDIGTIFLDSKMKIKRFTPSMSKIINLIQTDIGRSMEDLSSNLNYKDLIKDVKTVLSKLMPYTATVQSTDGTWYKMQIMPYRTSQNVIEGVVITFVDITTEQLLTQELKGFKENYEHLLETTKTIVYTQDKDLKYTSIANMYPNVEYRNIIGKKDEDIFSKDDVAKLERIKQDVLKSKKSIRKVVSLTMGNALRYYDLTVRPIEKKHKIEGLACTATDITELKDVQKELTKLKQENDGKG